MRCISASTLTVWCFDIRLEDATPVMTSVLAVAAAPDLSKILHDLRQLLRRDPHRDSRQSEAIDMGRRGIHNEGSSILMERLKDKVTLDTDTARRLFTLICVLHWKDSA